MHMDPMHVELPAERALVPVDAMHARDRPQRSLPRVDGGFLAQIVAAHLREGDQRRRVKAGCARAHGAYRGPAQAKNRPASGAGRFDTHL